MKKFKLIGVAEHKKLKLQEVKTGKVIISSPEDVDVFDKEYFVLRKEKRTRFLSDMFVTLFCYTMVGIIVALFVLSGFFK